MGFLFLITKKAFHTRHLKVLCLAGVVLASSFYGAALNGFDLGATFYAIRLICLVLCGVQIGEIFFSKFGDSIIDFYKIISVLYTVQASFGFFIYIIFRESAFFWAFLGRLGIACGGDPHVGRFVSVYFDPNFYSVIAIIPFIAMLRLVYLNPSARKFIYLGFLSLSIFLTWSRSGIATLFMLLACLAYDYISSIRFFLIRTKILFGVFVGFVAASSIVLFRSYDATFFFLRLSGLKGDGSAFSRWNSLKTGLEIFGQHPMFGVGYNYLRKYLAEGSHSSIDSSVLSTFANFGLVVSMLFVCVFVVYWYKFRKSIEVIRIKNRELYVVGGIYSVYLLIVVCFSSLFNNILYYQFWLVPMVAIYTYLSFCIKKTKISFLKNQ